MRSSICEPGLVGGVEDGRRDLADAAAEPGLELAVDDHRRLLEALLGRALAGRAVERERLARRDQRAVDQLRDERDVVQAARDAAVGRVVAADDAGDPHRLRVGRRALGGRRADGELGRPSGGRGRRGEERLRGRRHVDAEAGLVRDDVDAARLDLEAGVDRRALDRLAQLVEPGFRARPGDRDLRRAADRQRQELGDPPARQLPARSLVLEADGRREGGAGLPAAGARSAAVTSIGSMRTGQRHRLPALEPRERADDRRRRGLLVEPAAGLTRDDLDPRARAGRASPRRGCWSIASREAGELEVERGAVGLHRRRDLGAEEPRLQAAEAADGAEALALAGGASRSRRPSRPRRRASWP